MIKRIALLVVLILLINFIPFIYNKEDSKIVFNELTNEAGSDYNIHKISVKDIKITTKNLNDYFKNIDINIIGIYPDINPIYMKKVKKELTYYLFEEYSVEKNINNFIKYYIKIMNNNGFVNEAIRVEISGIPLKTLNIYISNKDLDILLDNNKNIKLL